MKSPKGPSNDRFRMFVQAQGLFRGSAKTATELLAVAKQTVLHAFADVFYRTAEGRQRWYTIGRHGKGLTPTTARAEAKRILGRVTEKEDPAAEKRAKRNAQTVAELCDLYMRDAGASRIMTRRREAKKESTLITDRGRIERHIKPLLGGLSVGAVTRDDVESFMHDVAAGSRPRGSRERLSKY